MEMLKEFKMLLNHSPLPISTERLIQLLALNMFAIDNGQLKGEFFFPFRNSFIRITFLFKKTDAVLFMIVQILK